MKVARRYFFHASHSLPDVPGYDKPHEHDYTVEVVAEGEYNEATGMIVDTAMLDEHFQPLCSALENTDLNVSVQPSTVERLAQGLAQGFMAEAPFNVSVRVWEDNNRWGQAP